MNIRSIGRHPVNIGLLLGGLILGTALAYSVAHIIRIREVHGELRAYAERLVRIVDRIGDEDTRAIDSVLHANLPFCSDQELAFMRDFVFHSPYIRDMGRVKDGRLYCTTGIGRLSTPPPTATPDISSGDLKLYFRRPTLISTSTTGFIVEMNGVSLVLNPDTIQNLDEPPRFYIGLFYDRDGRRMTQTYGPPLPLSTDQVLAGRLVELNGILYQPLCSPTSMACQVAVQSRNTIVQPRGLLFITFLIGGALLGLAFAVILILFYKERRSLERQLRRAIRSGRIDLVYQPVVHLESEAVVGAEAMVRWKNDAGEAVKPETFITLAEEKGFVGEITQFVLRKSLQELADLLVDGNFKLTINIASADLSDPAFFSQLKHAIATAHVPSSAIGLELTERSTADQNVAIRAISELKAAGHSVYIDDFGTGYSSLSYLHNLAVDAIKIDRNFTQTVGTDAVTASVVPQILNMASELNLMVVVEGIETSEQAEYFRRAGAGILGQGWFFGRPVPALQLKRIVHDKAIEHHPV
jgi:sensor c-di-GMP phosphodiesterase-like protein